MSLDSDPGWTRTQSPSVVAIFSLAVSLVGIYAKIREMSPSDGVGCPRLRQFHQLPFILIEFRSLSLPSTHWVRYSNSLHQFCCVYEIKCFMAVLHLDSVAWRAGPSTK